MYLMGVYHVIAAFGGRWAGVAFLILALSGKLALGPIAPGSVSLRHICHYDINENIKTQCPGSNPDVNHRSLIHDYV
jgi:hypothetical protein